MNLFNISNNFIFKIDNFELNKPLNILNTNGQYLSCQEINNVVDFFEYDDNSGKQKWIIEKKNYYENIYYIKTQYNRLNYTKYLGSPNKDNNVYLYTSKNRFTEWSIEIINEDLKLYKITFIGNKFNNEDIQLIIIKISDNIDWLVPYNNIGIIYNIDNINKSNYNKIFLHYIINNFNNLPNRVIFGHTDCLINNSTFLYGIDNYELHDNVQPLGISDNKLLSFNKIKTNYNLEYDTIKINGNILNKKYNDNEINKYNDVYRNIFNDNIYSKLTLIEGLLIKTSIPINNINFNDYSINSLLSGIFSLAKFNIVKNNIFVYQRMFEYINANNFDFNYDLILQSIWLYLFN